MAESWNGFQPPERTEDDERSFLHSAPRPLSAFHFQGTLRRYQGEVLTKLSPADGQTLHVVAPPGSGKTLLGSLLAAKNGRRTLVLSPTVVIQDQWVDTAERLAATAPIAVSRDPKELGDFCCLTYQMLSVLSDSNAFEDLAESVWIDELCLGGQSVQQAQDFLAHMGQDNPSAYQAGIRQRTNKLRKEYVRANPDQIGRALHPNAVALLDRLVSHGVRTIIVDECHHLLDHWALVVAYLRQRLIQQGANPLIIGLTATLPSTEDEREYANYVSLLGAVDYHIPTPAVIREGNLAPSRDLVWATSPTKVELDFIKHHEAKLLQVMKAEFATPEGRAFLLQCLNLPETAVPQSQVNQLIDAALAEDFAFALSASTVLVEVDPGLAKQLGITGALADPCTNDDCLAVLGRFGLQELLRKTEHAERWGRLKRTLADFGLHLTDKGVRRAKDPVADILAKSDSKYGGAVEVLKKELASPDGPAVRAAVVTDFVRHTNKRGSGDQAREGGAVRAFEVLCQDPVVSVLRPVLVTRQHLWVREEDADKVAEGLRKNGCADVTTMPVNEVAGTCRIVSSQTPTEMLGEMGQLIEQGTVRLIVGTRGILGEGWDCPSINTLIDLTTAATSSSTQQLRGRTLRLDPHWPTKVAHNWTVVCLVGRDSQASDAGELRRLARKHEHLWGIDADDQQAIVTGLRAVYQFPEMRTLAGIEQKQAGAKLSALNAAMELPSRAEEYSRWRVGEPMAQRVSEQIHVSPVEPAEAATSFVSPRTTGSILFAVFMVVVAAEASIFRLVVAKGGTLPVLLIALALALVVVVAVSLPSVLRALRRSARDEATYVRGALALAQTMSAEGLTGVWSESDLSLTPVKGSDGPIEAYRIEVIGGSVEDRERLAQAIGELFGSVQSPRFFLEVGQLYTTGDWTLYGVVSRIVDKIWRARAYLPVPKEIAVRRDRAELFTANWNRQVGPGRLVELRDRDGAMLLSRVRRLYREKPGTNKDGALADSGGRRQIWS